MLMTIMITIQPNTSKVDETTFMTPSSIGKYSYTDPPHALSH